MNPLEPSLLTGLLAYCELLAGGGVNYVYVFVKMVHVCGKVSMHVRDLSVYVCVVDMTLIFRGETFSIIA